MGASNAIAAFDLYAGMVPPTSLLLLVRMALTAKDADADPWFEQGQEALARMALGRGRHAEVTKSDVAAVERALAPLRKIGAITTDRRAAPRRKDPATARYRLHLKTPNVPRKTGGVEVQSTDEHPTVSVGRQNAQHPTETVESPDSTSHGFRVQRPTVSASTSHGFRGVPYKEEEKRGEREEEKSGRAVGRAAVPRRDESTALATVTRIPTGEHPIVPQAGAATIGVGTETASTITAGWIDHCRDNDVTLPRDVIGRYAKAVKQALDDGFDPNLIKRALSKMREDGQASWPGSFGAYLVRIQEAATSERARRKLTPGEESAARLVAGADDPGEVINAVSRFFQRGAS